MKYGVHLEPEHESPKETAAPASKPLGDGLRFTSKCRANFLELTQAACKAIAIVQSKMNKPSIR
jgi:hypothetical protein